MGTAGGDEARRRKRLEEGGTALAHELGIDLDAFGVGSNLHWAMTLMKLHFERVPLSQVGLSMTDFVTLWSLRVAGGELEAGDVAGEVGLPPSSFTAVAKRLEQRGLLTRRRADHDRRSMLVSVTDDGAALAARAFQLVNREAIRMTSGLSPEQMRSLADMLRTVADELSDMSLAE